MCWRAPCTNQAMHMVPILRYPDISIINYKDWGYNSIHILLSHFNFSIRHVFLCSNRWLCTIRSLIITLQSLLHVLLFLRLCQTIWSVLIKDNRHSQLWWNKLVLQCYYSIFWIVSVVNGFSNFFYILQITIMQFLIHNKCHHYPNVFCYEATKLIAF